MDIIYRTSEIKRKLSDNEISEEEAVFCILGVALLGLTTNYINLSSLYPVSLNFFIEMIVMMAITLWGIIYCFKQNGGRRGVQFIVRFSCLSWSVGWKFFIFSFLLAMAYMIIARVFVERINYNYYEVILGISYALTTAAYYATIARHIRYIRSSSNECN